MFELMDAYSQSAVIKVIGVGGGGGNAVQHMVNSAIEGVDFVCANTDSQALKNTNAKTVMQLGSEITKGLGAGANPVVGREAAIEDRDRIHDVIAGADMLFITAGMGGGTGTGAAPVVARAARELGILTVGVVTKPFQFEGGRRLKTAEEGILELQKNVDTLIVIPNQNLFRIANDKTTFADAFGMADQVLYSGVACMTDLMVRPGLINLDFADVRSVMRDMGKAMMGTGESSGEGRAMQAAEAAISNPLLDETSMGGAQGLLISITGGRDMTLFEVDEAATRIREEIDADANIIVGATFDESLDGIFRVSVVATGIDHSAGKAEQIPTPTRTEAIARQSMLAMAPGGSEEPATEDLEQEESKISAALDLPNPLGIGSGASTVEKNGVRIEPLKRTAETSEVLDDDFENALEQELMPSQEEFIPPSPDMPDVEPATATMPSVEDFPPIAQAVTKDQDSTHSGNRDGSPMSLLQKLKSGFGVRETTQEEERERIEPSESASVSVNTEPSQTPNHQPSARVDNNPYAPKLGSLDKTGRSSPSAQPISEDDQLEIPAFLRRQAN